MNSAAPIFSALFTISTISLSSCHRQQADDRLVITGSSTVAPLAAELAKRFEAENPGVRVDVQTGGSSRGIRDAREGLADIGMVSRALKAEEADLTPHRVALDGICVIVHGSNSVVSLTEAQIVDIYKGKIERWREVGGSDAPITVVNKAAGRSTLELFLGHFRLKPAEIDADVVIGDNQQGLKTVSGNPNAIAYVSIGAAEYASKAGDPIKPLPLDGIDPTTAAVKRGDFPLSRPLNFVTSEQRPVTDLGKRFLAFARSPAINDLVEAQYLVPVAE